MPLFARACDECKRRKVRCDAANPCANCRIANLTCAFQIQPRRRGRKPRADRRLSHVASPEAPVTPVEGSPTPQAERSSTYSSSASPSYSGGHQHHIAPQPVRAGSTSNITPPSIHHAPSINTLGSSPCAAAPAVARGVHGSLHTQPGVQASRIRHSLVLEVGSILQPSLAVMNPDAADIDHLLEPVLHIMHKCIDMFVQYIFPNTPIAHEPSLRLAVSDVAEGLTPQLCADASRTNLVPVMRSFTLITALCAFVTSVVPENLIPASIPLTWPFYHASRAMLRLYEEFDLESPVASSYTSRIWQSSALQNVTGKNGVAWHVSGEVTVMAMRTRLYSEETFGQTSALESQLLRANFWLIYLTDRTATAFEGRPSVMSDILSHGLLTLRDQGPCPEPLLDPSNPMNRQPAEASLIQGFHLKTRLWATVADFMHKLKSFANRKEPVRPPNFANTTDDDWAELVQVHRDFLSVLDDLPACLRSPNGVAPTAAIDDPVSSYQAQSFWALRNNILSVYHCMKLVILHECMLQGIPEVLGLENEAESLAVRQLEIVQEFLLEMQLAPFMCLKVQGEAAIQRIRRVGCILLEMVNHAINSALHKRATSQFNQILDILTSLDSKATATELGAGITSNSTSMEHIT